MLQPTALIVGIYKEFLGFHLIDTVWALILVNAGFNLAFAVWILNAYFASIPRRSRRRPWWRAVAGWACCSG
jgi:multiple sugar transport system permease protein